MDLLSATSATTKVLCSTQIAGTSATTVYTAGSGAVIKHGTLCNISGASVNVSVSIVPSGGTADGTHRVLSAEPVAAGDTLSLAGVIAGACLGAGDFVSVTASTGAAIDVVLTGVELA